MTKKWSTPITDDNGGLHSPVNYVKARRMLLTHTYAIGLLYHLVLTGTKKEDGSYSEPTREDYQWAMQRICKELRSKGMPCMWKGCYELDDKKRFHFHAFILIEAKHTHPDSIIHYRKGHWLAKLLASRDIGFNIAPPKDPMHYVADKQVNYMYVAKKGPKLEDALVRISYLYKARSKEGVTGQLYTASTNRESKIVPPIDALASKEEAISTEDKGNDMTTLTPAAFKYVAGIYETAVDAGMNVAEIQQHLKDSGIVRSLWQVRNDLSNVFGFTGYADAHTAPPRPNVAELDKLIDRMPERGLRANHSQMLANFHKSSYSSMMS